MTLDGILDTLEGHLQARFISRDERWGRVRRTAERIDGAYLDARLDTMALSLKKQAYGQRNADLREAIGYLDAARGIDAHALEAYDILRQKGAQYRARFAQLHTHLDSGEGSFDDLALALDHLRTDRYLNRRASQAVREQKDALETRLTQRLSELQRERYAPCAAPTSPWYGRIASAAIAATTLLCAVPSATYLALLG